MDAMIIILSKILYIILISYVLNFPLDNFYHLNLEKKGEREILKNKLKKTFFEGTKETFYKRSRMK